MSTLDKSERNVVRAILTATNYSARHLNGDATAELTKVRGAAILRHIGETLDDLGHARPADGDTLAQAIDRASDKIVLAIALASPTCNDKAASLNATVAREIAQMLLDFDNGRLAPEDEQKED